MELGVRPAQRAPSAALRVTVSRDNVGEPTIDSHSDARDALQVLLTNTAHAAVAAVR